MARPLRIELAGGLYHVTSRGDRREDIFLDEADRLAWLELFGQVCRRFNWVCHAWCLMDNHFHIVVETVEGNLAQGMRQLNGVYTQTFNRTHGRVGHVFQGRYKAVMVEKDSYLLELARYVVLNPLRACMVKEVAAWPWSSYAAMTGTQPAPAWLQTDWILGQFSSQRPRAIIQYIDFVRAGVGLASVWEQLEGQIYLGSEAFIKRMQQIADTATIGEIPRAQRRPPAKPLTHYQDKHRDAKAAMVAAYATGDYTMQEIADHFGVHYATVSRAVKLRRDA
ncbi:transposase [Ferriphaselus sp. R-1]|uniref:REP-associated tyrosine transposase n=1 Tax=Ferriphaselus sp. R-1 TaxID=1485544 RepID=UPI000551BDAC|nr:transposase [Ferriphaselus sp. R-1]